MQPRSRGKDTTSGHWEISGVLLAEPFPTYPEGFPRRVTDAFESAIGMPILGNVAASGTDIIARLGDEHVATGRPIVYTSADSVFQIATHVDVTPLETLYEWCRVARAILRGPDEVGRVIARPFAGSSGEYARVPGRHDFSVEPTGPTMLDAIESGGLEVVGVGKISDIFAGRGVTSSRPTKTNEEGVDEVIDALATMGRGLVFANLVEFDERFGHRNDPTGYAGALEAFDARLPEILGALGARDALVITADHGNDPTTASTDHSRENVPLLVTGPGITGRVDLGTRTTFADCGATIAALLGVHHRGAGDSFARVLTA
jgi:phosphopentomutase